MADQCNSLKRSGECGRNRTYNLLIKSWFSRTRSTAASEPTNQRLTFTKARTEAFDKSSEKGRIGAYRLEAYGTLMAHLRR